MNKYIELHREDSYNPVTHKRGYEKFYVPINGLAFINKKVFINGKSHDVKESANTILKLVEKAENNYNFVMKIDEGS